MPKGNNKKIIIRNNVKKLCKKLAKDDKALMELAREYCTIGKKLNDLQVPTTGDKFAVVGHSLTSKMISGIQWLWCRITNLLKGEPQDDNYKFSHTGIVTGPEGTTLESLSKIKEGNLSKYVGKYIKIVRPVGVSLQDNLHAVGKLKNAYLGKIYPGWRLFLYLFPGLAETAHIIKLPVCSELVMLHERITKHFKDNPWGMSPDDVVELWEDNPDKYELIFEGILEKER